MNEFWLVLIFCYLLHLQSWIIVSSDSFLKTIDEEVDDDLVMFDDPPVADDENNIEEKGTNTTRVGSSNV